MYNILYVYFFKFRYCGYLFNVLDMNFIKGKKILKILRFKMFDKYVVFFVFK